MREAAKPGTSNSEIWYTDWYTAITNQLVIYYPKDTNLREVPRRQ